MTISASPTTRRPAGLAGKLTAFSLVELLIVIGIISLLATMSVPMLLGIAAAKTRLECKWNMGQIAKACITFATESESEQDYPAGSVGNAGSGDPDDYTLVSPQVRTDLGLMGVSDEMLACRSIGDQEWMFSTTDPFRMGVIYWLGRDDILDASSEVIYQSPAKHDKQYDPTSATVVTCLAYDPYSTGTATDTVVPGSVIPHMGKTHAEYPHDEAPNPWDKNHPDGLAVGFRGGSADFVAFEDLTPIDQLHRIWYVNY